SSHLPSHAALVAAPQPSVIETSPHTVLPSTSKNVARIVLDTLPPASVSTATTAFMLSQVSEMLYAPSLASVANAPYAAIPSGVSRLPPITSSIPSGSVTIALITSTSLDVIELMFVCNDRIFGDDEELAPPLEVPDPPPPPEPVPPPPIPDPHAVTITATTSAPKSAPTLRVTDMRALVSRRGRNAARERGPYRANAIRITSEAAGEAGVGGDLVGKVAEVVAFDR